ncbi:MAG: HAMP domain-containing sensor histidine kinase [Planctomycetota bacterium]|nr:HAMP domain-containing sensor histidine kinase [Planctomycetota bacterium]
MADYIRTRRTLRLPIWSSVVFLTLNAVLLVTFVVLSAFQSLTGALTIGIVAISIGMFGVAFYGFLTVKEIRLNRRQANFVDSVTHELKTPIASLRLYLETLSMRKLTADQRAEFYGIMQNELQRLDHLINHLLEVGRLGEIGQMGDPEDVLLKPLLNRAAELACNHHGRKIADVFHFDLDRAVIRAPRLACEMIFGNLLDNAVKYGGDSPRVDVAARVLNRGRLQVSVLDNGVGVPSDMRRKIFRLFVRGGDELHRKQSGTGLGLYIVRTLVHILRGRVSVRARADGPGSVFEITLPGTLLDDAKPPAGAGS